MRQMLRNHNDGCDHDGYHSLRLRIARDTEQLFEDRVCDDCGVVLESRAGPGYAPKFIADGAPPDTGD